MKTANSKTKALKAIIQREGSLDLILIGRCMDPFLIEGDCARVAAASDGDVKCGALCCSELANGALVMHRIVGQKGRRLILKGDCSTMAETCETEQLIGVVKCVKLRGSTEWLSCNADSWRSRVAAVLSRGLVAAVPGENNNQLKRRCCWYLVRKWGEHSRKALLRRCSAVRDGEFAEVSS